MSSWPSCDSFVCYDFPNFCNGPQHRKFKLATQAIFGKPSINKTVKRQFFKQMILNFFEQKGQRNTNCKSQKKIEKVLLSVKKLKHFLV